MPRNLREGETGLSADEQALLDRICEAYYLPAWCSIDDYRRIFEAQGLQARATLRLQLKTYCRLLHRQTGCLPMQQCTEGGFLTAGACHMLQLSGAVQVLSHLIKILLWHGRHAALVCPAKFLSPACWPSSSCCTCILPQEIKTADWSEEVAPFWGAVIRSALSAEGFSGLFKAGWTTIKARGAGAFALYHEPASAAWFCMCVLHDAISFFSCLTSGEALLVCRVHW